MGREVKFWVLDLESLEIFDFYSKKSKDYYIESKKYGFSVFNHKPSEEEINNALADYYIPDFDEDSDIQIIKS